MRTIAVTKTITFILLWSLDTGTLRTVMEMLELEINYIRPSQSSNGNASQPPSVSIPATAREGTLF